MLIHFPIEHHQNGRYHGVHNPSAQGGIKSISQKSWILLILSGLATGASWLCLKRKKEKDSMKLVDITSENREDVIFWTTNKTITVRAAESLMKGRSKAVFRRQ